MEQEMSGMREVQDKPPLLANGERLSILKFLTGFMAYAVSKGRRDFPAFDDIAWHKLLYRLKKNCSCFSVLSFDWNGPNPKCREFLDFNLGFSYMCSPVFPLLERVVLNEPFLQRAWYLEVYCDKIPPDEVVQIAEECGFWN